MFNKKLIEEIIKLQNTVYFLKGDLERISYQIDGIKKSSAKDHYDFVMFTKASGYERTPEKIIPSGWKKI